MHSDGPAGFDVLLGALYVAPQEFKRQFPRSKRFSVHMAIWVSTQKYGNSPQIIPFVHRVWNHYFHHPFWGFPLFWKHPYTPSKTPQKTSRKNLHPLHHPLVRLMFSTHQNLSRHPRASSNLHIQTEAATEKKVGKQAQVLLKDETSMVVQMPDFLQMTKKESLLSELS